MTYGVSPQPAQAPENSNRGCRYWLPLTVAVLTPVLTTGCFMANSQFASWAACVSSGFMTRALFLAGQVSAQLPQPVQSSGLTCTRT